MINIHELFSFSDAQKSLNADNEMNLVWIVPSDLPYFEGHFPDNPILPGVAVVDLFQVLLGGEVHFIKTAKFTEFIRPNDTLTIKAKLNPNQSWSVQITNQRDVIVCKATLQLTT